MSSALAEAVYRGIQDVEPAVLPELLQAVVSRLRDERPFGQAPQYLASWRVCPTHGRACAVEAETVRSPEGHTLTAWDVVVDRVVLPGGREPEGATERAYAGWRRLQQVRLLRFAGRGRAR
jgi:hypothetical protein